jgi:hypothetical protein
MAQRQARLRWSQERRRRRRRGQQDRVLLAQHREREKRAGADGVPIAPGAQAAHVQGERKQSEERGEDDRALDQVAGGVDRCRMQGEQRRCAGGQRPVPARRGPVRAAVALQLPDQGIQRPDGGDMEGEAEDAVRLDAAPEDLHEGEREIRRMPQLESQWELRVLGEPVAGEEVAVVEERRVGEERQVQRAAHHGKQQEHGAGTAVLQHRMKFCSTKKRYPEGYLFRSSASTSCRGRSRAGTWG